MQQEEEGMQTRKSGLEGMKGEKSFCFVVDSHSLCSSFFQRLSLSLESCTYLFSSYIQKWLASSSNNWLKLTNKIHER